LDGIPGWHYNPVKDAHYYITLEEANYFFYTQLLTGDRVDNIKGVDGIGAKKAEKLLANLTTECQLYNACRAAYTGRYGLDGDKFLEENALLLWIQRKENILWEKPC
jgi:5'-3' exonuclease